MKQVVRYQKLHERAVPPTYGSEAAAGAVEYIVQGKIDEAMNRYSH